jgi:hypothetical protein
VDSLCHPWFTTTNLSYRFPIFETSATALCGTTGRTYCLKVHDPLQWGSLKFLFDPFWWYTSCEWHDKMFDDEIPSDLPCLMLSTLFFDGIHCNIGIPSHHGFQYENGLPWMIWGLLHDLGNRNLVISQSGPPWQPQPAQPRRRRAAGRNGWVGWLQYLTMVTVRVMVTL